MISNERLKNIIERLQCALESDDVEIKDCVIISIIEELEETNQKDMNDQ